MEIKKENLHVLGYFSKLHGYKGELTICMNTADVRDYEALPNLFVDLKGGLVPYFIELIEYKTNSTAKVKLEGINNEADARPLLKCSIYIDKKYLSESDEEILQLRAIEGYNVIDANAGEIGIVNRIEESKVNPLLVVKAGNKEILLPLHRDFFEKIDKKKKRVHIKAPEGLIDFYMQ